MRGRGRRSPAQWRPIPECCRHEPLRRRFDPLAGRLPPHRTLVYPFESDLSADDLRQHVERAVVGVAPFPLRLAGIVGSEHEYLFLGVKRGNDALIALHDRLYQGPLRAYLSREQP